MKVSPQMVAKYSYIKANKPSAAIENLNLTAEEKAFCLYCSAVGVIVPEIYSKDANYALLEKPINTANKLLEVYASDFIPTNNEKHLTYSKENFINYNLDSQYTSPLSNFMYGVVYAETLQAGFKLERDTAFQKDSIECDVINHNSFYLPSHIANSIDIKIRKSEREL